MVRFQTVIRNNLCHHSCLRVVGWYLWIYAQRFWTEFFECQAHQDLCQGNNQNLCVLYFQVMVSVYSGVRRTSSQDSVLSVSFLFFFFTSNSLDFLTSHILRLQHLRPLKATWQVVLTNLSPFPAMSSRLNSTWDEPCFHIHWHNVGKNIALGKYYAHFHFCVMYICKQMKLLQVM